VVGGAEVEMASVGLSRRSRPLLQSLSRAELEKAKKPSSFDLEVASSLSSLCEAYCVASSR